MRRSYGYTPRQNSGWDTTSQDYHAHISRMERMPTMVPGGPQYPKVHKAFNNNYNLEEEEDVGLVEEHDQQQQQRRSPNSKKKVHLTECVETIEESTDGNSEAYEENTLDVKAGEYIQQRRKGFELCKWKTFKAH